MLLEFDRRIGMRVQRPEAAAEVLVLVDRHLLVAEEITRFSISASCTPGTAGCPAACRGRRQKSRRRW